MSDSTSLALLLELVSNPLMMSNFFLYKYNREDLTEIAKDDPKLAEWIEDLGRTAEAALKEAQEKFRQAEESRATNAALLDRAYWDLNDLRGKVGRLVKALKNIMQRSNETGTGITAWVDTIHAVYSIAQQALAGEKVLERKEEEARQDIPYLLSLIDRTREFIKASGHALRSYQYGNSSPDLAEALADKAEALLRELEVG